MCKPRNYSEFAAEQLNFRPNMGLLSSLLRQTTTWGNYEA